MTFSCPCNHHQTIPRFFIIIPSLPDSCHSSSVLFSSDDSKKTAAQSQSSVRQHFSLYSSIPADIAIHSVPAWWCGGLCFFRCRIFSKCNRRSGCVCNARRWASAVFHSVCSGLSTPALFSPVSAGSVPAFLLPAQPNYRGNQWRYLIRWYFSGRVSNNIVSGSFHIQMHFKGFLCKR